MTLQGDAARLSRPAPGFGQHPALANPGVARNEYTFAGTLLGSAQGGFDTFQFAGAADQQWRDNRSIEGIHGSINTKKQMPGG